MSTTDQEVARISAKEAVQAAVRAIPDLLGGRAPKGVRVEEVRPPRQDHFWRVTVSYLEAPDLPEENPILALAHMNPLRPGPPPERVLRVIEVEAATGMVEAMLLREDPG